MKIKYIYDKNKTRLHKLDTIIPATLKQERSKLNWFFIPGGAGMDSRYLSTLTRQLDLPGKLWGVDFPGNGDNLTENDDFFAWRRFLLDLVKSYPHSIIVGHSFGAMLPLMEPQMENFLRGFIILNSAPCNWQEDRVRLEKEKNLPDLYRALNRYKENRNLQTFRDFVLVAIPHMFNKNVRNQAHKMLRNLPYNYKAYDWWIKTAPVLYYSHWVPQRVPTLIICGENDFITPAYLFDNDQRFNRPNIKLVKVKNAGHFAWFEQGSRVKQLFEKFSDELCEN